MNQIITVFGTTWLLFLLILAATRPQRNDYLLALFALTLATEATSVIFADVGTGKIGGKSTISRRVVLTVKVADYRASFAVEAKAR